MAPGHGMTAHRAAASSRPVLAYVVLAARARAAIAARMMSFEIRHRCSSRSRSAAAALRPEMSLECVVLRKTKGASMVAGKTAVALGAPTRLTAGANENAANVRARAATRPKPPARPGGLPPAYGSQHRHNAGLDRRRDGAGLLAPEAGLNARAGELGAEPGLKARGRARADRPPRILCSAPDSAGRLGGERLVGRSPLHDWSSGGGPLARAGACRIGRPRTG